MSNFKKEDLLKRLVNQTGSSIENSKITIFYIEQAQKYYISGDFSKAQFFYEEAFLFNNKLKQMGFQIPYAHSILLSTDWEKFDRVISKDINYLNSSGWLNSIWKNQAMNADSHPIPWYTYPAIEFIEDKTDKCFYVFEYGSGMSTLWWALRVNKIYSVEHNSDFFNSLIKIVPKNVYLSLKENSTEYVARINEFPDQSFDCVVIDGIERCQCVKYSIPKLKNTGFLIFDNTDKKAYDEGIIYLAQNDFKRIDFFGMSPCYSYKNCTSIFFKDDNLFIQKTLPSKKNSCLGKSYYQTCES